MYLCLSSRDPNIARQSSFESLKLHIGRCLASIEMKLVIYTLVLQATKLQSCLFILLNCTSSFTLNGMFYIREVQFRDCAVASPEKITDSSNTNLVYGYLASCRFHHDPLAGISSQ